MTGIKVQENVSDGAESYLEVRNRQQRVNSRLQQIFDALHYHMNIILYLLH